MEALEIFGVDAFTDHVFAGNPAAVVVLDDDAAWPDTEWMQSFASEVNWSETAFVRRDHAGFALRWFTPGAEVDLCGHATLATAHVLWKTRRLAPDETARFDTRSGELRAVRLDDGAIELDFPALPPEPTEAPTGLLESLGVGADAVEAVARSRFDLLVVVHDAATVQRLRPDFRGLRIVDARGVIVSAPAEDGDEAQFVSRFFAPAVGVDEDPVTGSAHCVLTPYWSARLGLDSMVARQVSRRGGELRLSLRGDRVGIGGRAVTVYSGRLGD